MVTIVTVRSIQVPSRKAEADQAERHGDRHALEDQIGHAVLEEEAFTEVADNRAAHPVHELHYHRTVEAVGLADDLDVLLRGAGSGDRDGEVAGQARQHEGKRHHRECDQHTKNGTTQNEAEHGSFQSDDAAIVSPSVSACNTAFTGTLSQAERGVQRLFPVRLADRFGIA
jgi:hypothetical protein